MRAFLLWLAAVLARAVELRVGSDEASRLSFTPADDLRAKALALRTRSASMQQACAESVKIILIAVDSLAEAVGAHKLEQVNEKAGRVFEFCQAATKLPKSNKIAVKRAIMKVVSTVKDTAKEFQEMADETEIVESRAEGECQGVGGDARARSSRQA